MIVLTTSRQYAEFAETKMFLYLDLLKKTEINNLQSCDKSSAEYLTVRVLHCLIDQVQLLFRKKLINTTSKTISIKMSDAAGIAFYKRLLTLPVPADDIYYNFIRNRWIEILDQQILK